MFGPGAQAQWGQDIVLGSITLRVKPGTWKVIEAPRFGEKISIGALKYSDFEAFESAHALSNLDGGFGLQAYSDHPDPNAAQFMFKEAQNVDTFQPIKLALLQTSETLTGSTSPPVWGGEFLGEYVVVAGTKLYTRNSNGTWDTLGITLPAVAKKGAIGVFDGKLIIGFGGDAKAVYTNNLASTANIVDASGSIYAWAFTADGAAAYVAGGPALTNSNKVISSADGVTYDSVTGIKCGGSDDTTNALAPGGGLVLVYVGMDDEFGAIDQGGTYRTLISFDSRKATNCAWMRHELSDGGNEQRGPVNLFFPRERSLWNYQPSDALVGLASNVSPLAASYLRASAGRGMFTALQGSARWMYAAIQDSTGVSWIAVRDARTGTWGLPYYLGSNTCSFIGITSLFPVEPVLLFGKGNNVASVILPLDGDVPMDSPQCRYASSGSVWLSDIDLGFPDEEKIGFVVRLNTRNVDPGHQDVTIYYSIDGSAYVLLGSALGDDSEFTDLNFDSDIVCRRLSIRMDLSTDDSTMTPEVHGITVRLSLNTLLRRTWNFTGVVPGGHQSWGEELESPKVTVASLWAMRRAGVSVSFRDRWGDNYDVRILKVGEEEIFNEETKTYEIEAPVVLLEVGAGAEPTVVWEPGAVGAETFLPIDIT